MKKLKTFPILSPNSALKSLMLIVVLAITSCQKTSVIDEIQSDFPNHVISSRSTETDVVEYAQWLINFVAPLVADEAVYADIISGNQNSALVTSKLISLGFSDFNDFLDEFSIKGNAVTSAVNSGLLSALAIEQILLQNIDLLDFTPIGGASSSGIGGALPCYDQLLIDLAFVAIEVAGAAYFGPWAAVGAAVLGISKAYLDFKNCLEGTYPSGS